MIYFNCDYNEGAHQNVLDAISNTNMVQSAGYGHDEYCEKARNLICDLCGNPELYVQFLVGGTQTNLTLIASALRPHQGVLCAELGHINVHETGAIEGCGHKVLALPSTDGKVTPDQVEEAYRLHVECDTPEHTVQPKMVYISNPTEVGTIYSKKELEDLSEVCKKNGLYLYIDGARLGYGLTAKGNDLDLPSIAKLCDAFYIGGTKIGALFGEAIVISNPALKEDFRYIIKQKGGLLAKGRLLGIQFYELLKDGLYFKISEHANAMAEKIKQALTKMGYDFLVDSPTNQLFVLMPDEKIEELSKKYSLSYDHRVDERTSCVRICTSWATKEENVDLLVQDIYKK